MVPSLYIHIPFCRSKCLYCDFYSRSGHFSEMTGSPAPEVQDYIGVLISQIERLQGTFDTIYIGGGTPTVLDNKLLERLLLALGKCVSANSEFTVEANPESLDTEKIQMLLGLGVNRLSIGLQSLDNRLLKKLGRIHSAEKAVEVIHNAAKNGFTNISADLIFGIWGEEPGCWKKDLGEALKLPLCHISSYALTYEKDTPLFDALKKKSVIPLEDEIVAAMYEAAIDKLAIGGFRQYEVSSFAKKGCRCRHNLSYWENNPYIGLGASAVSYIDGVRTRNVADAVEYTARARMGTSLAESSERLSPVERARETAAIKIRTNDGIGFAWFKEKTGFDFMELEGKAVEDLMGKELIKYISEKAASEGIALNRRGFLYCDTVSSALL